MNRPASCPRTVQMAADYMRARVDNLRIEPTNLNAGQTETGWEVSWTDRDGGCALSDSTILTALRRACAALAEGATT